jgi:hypothetical protein
MLKACGAILGMPTSSFASPAWMVTRDLLQLEEESGLRFASDSRGRRPFLPTFEGRECKVPQVPVSLPTLDESLGARSRGEFVERALELLAEQPDYACFTAHAESEGREYRKELEEILTRAGRPVVPLGEAPLDGLPRRAMRMDLIPGRPYPVCREEPQDAAAPDARR